MFLPSGGGPSPFTAVQVDSAALSRVGALEDAVASLAANLKLVLAKLSLDPAEQEAVQVKKRQRTPQGAIPIGSQLGPEEDEVLHQEVGEFGEHDMEVEAAGLPQPDTELGQNHKEVVAKVKAAKDQAHQHRGAVVGAVAADGSSHQANLRAVGLGTSAASASQGQALG